MRAVDDTPVWSIVCSFVGSDYRGQGVQRRLLTAAVDFARDHGVRTLEAYPVDKAGRSDNGSMWWGSRSLYEKAGFREVERREPDAPGHAPDPSAAHVGVTEVRPGVADDLVALTAIYNHYVTTSHVTFDDVPFSVDERQEWFAHYATSGPPTAPRR